MQANFIVAFFHVNVADGTVFVGPAAELVAATADWPQDYRAFTGDLESVLRAQGEIGRFRSLLVQWGYAHGTRAISNSQLCLEAAELVKNGRLVARFLPRFIHDLRGPVDGAEEPFRRFQIEGGYKKATEGVKSTVSEARPSRVLPPRTSPAKHETDFPDEATQARVLRKAAESGVPFCEVCAAAAKAKAA